MNDKLNRAEVEKRWRQFWDDHRDFDPRGVRAVLHDLLERLPFVFAYDAVRKGLMTMVEESGAELPPDIDGLSADELPVNSLAKLPIYRNYLALRAYAFYGLKLDDADLEPQDWEAFVEQEDSAMLPPQWLRDEDFKRSFAAVRARQKLDHPEWPVGLTADELAALVGVSRKSVLNLKAGGTFDTREDGSIAVESARRWLEQRPAFLPSVWHLQEGLVLRRPDEEDFIDGIPVWVPVTKDGTWFSPEHAMPDGCFYVTCAKHKGEETIDDYWEALAFLSRAASPRWRCPDEAGRWYLKPAAHWDRKTRQEIESLIEQIAE